MSLEKAKIGDAIYDVTTEKELMEHPELFGQYTAVRNNDGYIYPVRNRFDNRPGVYMTGGMNIYVQPQGSERSMYSEQNIINFREDLKFLIYTFNKSYKEYLPDNWNDGYKNVEIKVLKTKEDMQVVSLDKVAMMTQSEKDILWDYCINLLKTWKGNDIALNHSESFLVGYCYLLKGKEEDIKNALLNRYSEEEVNRFLILGKDISKRGIPIYKELT